MTSREGSGHEVPGRCAEEVSEHRPRALRAMFFLLGSVFVALAALGAFLPLLPTTPFLLLAAACYARASRRALAWLLGNRVFGPLIRNWQENRAIDLRTSVVSIGLIFLMIGTTCRFYLEADWQRAVVILTGLGVTTFLIRITRRTVGRPSDQMT